MPMSAECWILNGYAKIGFGTCGADATGDPGRVRSRLGRSVTTALDCGIGDLDEYDVGYRPVQHGVATLTDRASDPDDKIPP